MSIWVEMQQAHDRWDATCHPHWQRWMAQETGDDEAARYAAGQAEALEALAAGVDWLGATPGRDELSRLAADERTQAERWRGLARSLGVDAHATARAATRECAAVWAGGEAMGRYERLLVVAAVGAMRVAVATCVLGGLALHAERPADARECLMAEAVLGCRHTDVARVLLDAVEPVRAAVAVSHAEAALSVYWDLLDALESPVAQGRLLVA